MMFLTFYFFSRHFAAADAETARWKRPSATADAGRSGAGGKC
jgi:hypothetical protein